MRLCHLLVPLNVTNNDKSLVGHYSSRKETAFVVVSSLVTRPGRYRSSVLTLSGTDRLTMTKVWLGTIQVARKPRLSSSVLSSLDPVATAPRF